jgi:tRNA (cytidine32/uridine32-2'-O)-methyltransferase
MFLHPVRFVLFEPSHPGNMGAVARAIKTMGFSDLVFVNPAREIDGDARARSSGALDVLKAAEVCGSLEQAVAGCGMVVGASARRRRLAWPEMDPRELADVLTRARHTKPVAVVFGPERAGLKNSEMDLCNALVYIPSNPEYNSLNLAAAVQIVAYELRQAQRDDIKLEQAEAPPASAEDMERFYQHLESVLRQSGFLNPDNPRHLMRRLRRLFNRSRLDEREVNILRGILSALEPGSGRQE